MRVFQSSKLRQLNVSFSEPRTGDAGYDLFASESYEVLPQQLVVVLTGLHLEIPERHVGLIKDRSSIALRGLLVVAGVIDNSYRGEVKIVMVNLTDSPTNIVAGQKIAQLIVVPCYTETVSFVSKISDLAETERGDSGFGSTDK